MKYLLLYILLIALCCSVYFLKNEVSLGKVFNKVLYKPSPIPTLNIEREIEFSIIKGRYETLIFKGTFSNLETLKEILKLFNKDIINKIKIEKNIKSNSKIIEFTKKLIPKLNKKLLEWSIIYKDKKLLIEGKSTNRKDKESIDMFLAISNINYFNNIKVIGDEEEEIIKRLKRVLPKNSTSKDYINSDEAEEVISNLKEIVIDIPPLSIKTHQNKVLKKPKKSILKHPPISNKDTIIDKKELDSGEDIDIMSLPYVEFIDETTPPIEIKKHVIDEGIIYLPPSQEDEIEPKNIPWAPLYDIDEKIDEVSTSESINVIEESF